MFCSPANQRGHERRLLPLLGFALLHTSILGQRAAQNYEEIMDLIDRSYFTPQETGQYTVATWFYL